ncbi:polyprenyl diphosphate synthase [Alphaproteobacteria bacterium endosymbiont of Tiliacea citrago]|uniref:polyprenyl diphosphate synthase n=1 Tax=Alphaproteobacteria bacterium endosymbiont of Tiliacea citrago TaxID=3077944 RepID=UPI00313EA029
MCNHIALILDGNRRWGKKNKKSLTEAYKKGAEVLQEIVLELIKLKIPMATMYGFSFENWNRSLYEISVIMVAFMSFLEENIEFFTKNNIKIKFIGDLSFFDEKVKSILFELEYLTNKNTEILIQLAVSYSGRNEILEAMGKSQRENLAFEDCLYMKNSPDLLIRTGGCRRLSNFLLWQIAYTELFFLDKLWPEFCKEDLHNILQEYKSTSKNNGV